MIGRIAGVILHKGADQVLIDVRGVGYVVHVSARTLSGLPPAGEAAALYTDLLVREDLMQLFGFPTQLEKEWYRLLVTVQGVGAKAAMAILGALGAEGVGRAIALGDWSAIKAAPGVGPKLAQRVVMELKDKAPAIMAMGGALSAPADTDGAVIEADAPPRKTVPPRPAPANPSASATADALSALVNLGYGQGEAAAAVAEASGANPASAPATLIHAALRLLAPKA